MEYFYFVVREVIHKFTAECIYFTNIRDITTCLPSHQHPPVQQMAKTRTVECWVFTMQTNFIPQLPNINYNYNHNVREHGIAARREDLRLNILSAEAECKAQTISYFYTTLKGKRGRND